MVLAENVRSREGDLWLDMEEARERNTMPGLNVEGETVRGGVSVELPEVPGIDVEPTTPGCCFSRAGDGHEQKKQDAWARRSERLYKGQTVQLQLGDTLNLPFRQSISKRSGHENASIIPPARPLGGTIQSGPLGGALYAPLRPSQDSSALGRHGLGHAGVGF